MVSVPPSGTNGIPIGKEFWKQEAEKLDALEKGQPEWNVPVGKEEGEKVVKELKCNTKRIHGETLIKNAENIAEGAQYIAKGKALIDAGKKAVKEIVSQKSKQPKMPPNFDHIDVQEKPRIEIQDMNNIRLSASELKALLPVCVHENFDKAENKEEFFLEYIKENKNMPTFGLVSCDVDLTKKE